MVVAAGRKWWMCCLCKAQASTPTDIRHRSDCAFADETVDEVTVVSFGPWIDAEGKSLCELSDFEFNIHDEIEFVDGDILVVGDINREGGSCSCCSCGYDKVRRYRKAER
jgi:hypothetical protein